MQNRAPPLTSEPVLAKNVVNTTVLARYYAPERVHSRLRIFARSKKTYSKWTFGKSPTPIRTRDARISSPTLTTRPQIAAAESTENLWYLCINLINVYCS